MDNYFYYFKKNQLTSFSFMQLIHGIILFYQMSSKSQEELKIATFYFKQIRVFLRFLELNQIKRARLTAWAHRSVNPSGLDRTSSAQLAAPHSLPHSVGS
jgi:hypothetical protein